MPGANLPVSHTAREEGGTGSATRRCVPRPSAIAPARFSLSRAPIVVRGNRTDAGSHADYEQQKTGLEDITRRCASARSRF